MRIRQPLWRFLLGLVPFGVCGVAALLPLACQGKDGASAKGTKPSPPECPAGLLHCGAGCVDITQEHAHCGACDRDCEDQVCSRGECRDSCESGLTDCSGSCVDAQRDRAHCGACDVTCGAGQECVAGACGCGAELTACGDVCADLKASVSHCGRCGARCAAGQQCVAGQCTGEPLAWQEHVLDASGAIDPAAYARVAAATDYDAMDHRLGPNYEFFHGTSSEEFPLVWERPGMNGLYYQGDCRLENFDRFWTGAYAGNILYVPDAAGDAGIDRARFAWHFGDESGKATCYIFRTDIEKLEPDENLWFPKSPDPCVEEATWTQANGGRPPARPIAIARSRYDISHVGVVAFPTGLVGGTGYGNSGDRFPALHLGANKVPTAVTVSNNNEFAFVTVWDTKAIQGQLAVIALESKGPFEFHEQDVFKYIGLLNLGAYSRMKLLGFVDLPMKAPTSVSVMTDGDVSGAFIGERFAPDDRPFPHDLLDTQGARDFWANEPLPPKGYRARGGYVVVASRAENQVALVNVGPLVSWFRKMYFTTQALFAQTQNEGEAPSQWPFTFEHAPEARPVVDAVLDVPQPTAVSAGWPQSEGLEAPYGDPRQRAFVATLGGELRIYDISGWREGKPLVAKLIRTVTVGRNPTALEISHAWGHEELRNHLIVVSRGDREVGLYTVEGKHWKTLRDRRLLDPVGAGTTENHDIRIADFAGKQVLTYLLRPTAHYPLDQDYIWRLGPEGKDQWEFTHAFPRPGGVFVTSSVLFF